MRFLRPKLDGFELLTQEEGTAHFWPLDPDVLLRQASARAGRDLSPKEQTQYLPPPLPSR